MKENIKNLLMIGLAVGTAVGVYVHYNNASNNTSSIVNTGKGNEIVEKYEEVSNLRKIETQRSLNEIGLYNNQTYLTYNFSYDTYLMKAYYFTNDYYYTFEEYNDKTYFIINLTKYSDNIAERFELKNNQITSHKMYTYDDGILYPQPNHLITSDVFLEQTYLIPTMTKSHTFSSEQLSISIDGESISIGGNPFNSSLFLDVETLFREYQNGGRNLKKNQYGFYYNIPYLNCSDSSIIQFTNKGYYHYSSGTFTFIEDKYEIAVQDEMKIGMESDKEALSCSKGLICAYNPELFVYTFFQLYTDEMLLSGDLTLYQPFFTFSIEREYKKAFDSASYPPVLDGYSKSGYKAGAVYKSITTNELNSYSYFRFTEHSVEFFNNFIYWKITNEEIQWMNTVNTSSEIRVMEGTGLLMIKPYTFKEYDETGSVSITIGGLIISFEENNCVTSDELMLTIDESVDFDSLVEEYFKKIS